MKSVPSRVSPVRLARSWGASALVAAALMVLAACVASPRRDGRAQDSQPPPAQNSVVVDASYDWHSLVIAPFGTLLKEIPFALHEVLLFHDESPGAADFDGADCHGIDGAAPRFVGRQPDEYLLCFDHDRLARIEASVRLPHDEAAQVFARACALWSKDSESLQTVANACEGRDGVVTFSARLGSVPGELTAPLAMTLSTGSTSVARRGATDTVPRER